MLSHPPLGRHFYGSIAICSQTDQSVNSKLNAPSMPGESGVKEAAEWQTISRSFKSGQKKLWGGGGGLAPSSLDETDRGAPMTQVDDLSRSLAAFDQNTSLAAVVEMSE